MRVMYGRVGDCYVLVLKSKRWPRKCVLLFHQVECAAKFPDKKSFVVAAILRGTGGGRIALCMEDPELWPCERQDYQHQCLVWLCTSEEC